MTFSHTTYRCGNYSGEETIQGRKLFAEIRYSILTGQTKVEFAIYWVLMFRGLAFRVLGIYNFGNRETAVKREVKGSKIETTKGQWVTPVEDA